ncbi:ACP S-malonyltransferase [Nocardiopsis sp. RSe5-2]|uniref:[acyl-carrier-protein] S-malonyltransferase n=1 Tax=Nocardiopsis endophytica TaxID=3018445 RepID=A0ABT4U7N7_9ACTN|nr:ACP S-malonyltransferase [Nocardiopsis endophytica]MDA2812973.1 ACP S-malonyltransferase [Nocardiopsis endophytica]
MTDGSVGTGRGIAFPGQVDDRGPIDALLAEHAAHPLVKRLGEVLGTDDVHAADFADTRVAQPLTYTAGLLSAWHRPGSAPVAAMGHSLGEITALAYAGALAPEEGLALVRELGEIGERQWSARPSSLTAVMGLDAEGVEWARRTALASRGGFLDVSGYNGPQQTVLSGDASTARAAAAAAEALGATVQVLPIRGAYHSPLLGPHLPRWRAAVRALEWRDPRIPVVSSVDARTRTDRADLPELLTRWLVLPVRWADTMAEARRRGVEALVDAGPGRVLRRLGRRIGPPPFTDA